MIEGSGVAFGNDVGRFRQPRRGRQRDGDRDDRELGLVGNVRRTLVLRSAIELRAGSRLLLEGANLRIGPGDKVGLVRLAAGEFQVAEDIELAIGIQQPAIEQWCEYNLGGLHSGVCLALPSGRQDDDLHRLRYRLVAPVWRTCQA